MVDDISMVSMEESKDQVAVLNDQQISLLKQDISSTKQVKFKPGNKFTANALKKIQSNSQKFDFK
jgi:hypothetical protein